MLNILSSIGDVHSNAAMLALRNIDFANDPNRELTLAVGHLQAAHIAFSSWYMKLNSLQRGYHYSAFHLASQKDRLVCVMAAMTYALLGEHTLMKQNMQRANNALDYTRDNAPSMFAGSFNPKHYTEIITAEVLKQEQQIPKLSGEDLYRIEDYLTKLF